MKRLVFTNPEVGQNQVLEVAGLHEVAAIMAWYGAYFAGDDYTVTVDGVPVAMDKNGEIKSAVIGGDDVPPFLKEVN